jgi:hypothetical protein
MNGTVVGSPQIRMLGTRRMQCKDIPDEVFLGAVLRTPASDGTLNPASWRMRWNVHAELEATIGFVPDNLLLAKARKLIAAKKLGGCPCGCRGDYHLPCGQSYCCGGVATAVTEYGELKAAVVAGVEAHRSHLPRLFRGRDGIWRCPACDPPGLRERLANLIRGWRRR